MIKDKLMVGNWVMFADEYTQVTDVMCDCLNTSFAERIPYDMFEPIQLSPAILEKCGFDTEYDGKNLKRFTHSKNSKLGYDWYADVGWRFRYIGEYIECDTLHHLQNLVYSLTGTELTITL